MQRVACENRQKTQLGVAELATTFSEISGTVLPKAILKTSRSSSGRREAQSLCRRVGGMRRVTGAGQRDVDRAVAVGDGTWRTVADHLTKLEVLSSLVTLLDGRRRSPRMYSCS